jgi:hypothetical protein
MPKKYEQPKFRVCLLKNGRYEKTLYRCNTRDTAFINYHKIKGANKVLFPKKFINNNNGIKPVRYKICITKITECDDVFRTLRDDYGKIYTEKPLGDWTILDSDEYQIEETFWLYGMKSKGGARPNISEIVKRLVAGAYAKRMVKQVIVVHNKLLIYNENQFDMVVCKNLLDAQRLHHTLAKVCTKQKIKSVLFMGTASKVMVGRMYDVIHEETGWPYTKIRRTSTRP